MCMYMYAYLGIYRERISLCLITCHLFQGTLFNTEEKYKGLDLGVVYSAPILVFPWTAVNQMFFFT